MKSILATASAIGGCLFLLFAIGCLAWFIYALVTAKAEPKPRDY